MSQNGGLFHCISRTVGGQRLLGDPEKAVFCRMLRRVAIFSGVEVLTYCVMSNHFHVLVRVREQESLDDAELVRRYAALYPEEPLKFEPAPGEKPKSRIRRGPRLSPAALAKLLAKDDDQAEAWRERLRDRMNDVSEFLKTLKQRFAIWFNARHERFGTLWAERFKSVRVESAGFPIKIVAAYIDLNPVRAKLVKDPKDYHFCGYAEALGRGAGDLARTGIHIIVGEPDMSEDETLASYRTMLFAMGAGAKRSDPDAGRIDSDKARAVIDAGGALPLAKRLLLRMRFLSDGAVFGSDAFVRAWAERWQRATGRKKPADPSYVGEDPEGAKYAVIKRLWN